jgi:hypothetical protein
MRERVTNQPVKPKFSVAAVCHRWQQSFNRSFKVKRFYGDIATPLPLFQQSGELPDIAIVP